MAAQAPPADAHAGDLAALGYQQELKRELGPFASFSSGFSFVSILTTVFQLFALGFALGGPAFFWTWPIVFVGQFAVALCFAELAAQYPIAGAVYQWSRRVSNDPIGWVAGWLMMIGYIISIAAISIALQAVLPEVWHGFQIVGNDTSPLSADGSKNAIVLGTVCIALCALIGSLGVTKMSMLTRIGVTCEIIGVVVVLVLLFAHAHRGPGVIFHTNGVAGSGSYVWPFFASMLMAAYVMYGFDSAAELSEETSNPRRTAPKAILQCMLVSAVGGGLMILAALMAAPSITLSRPRDRRHPVRPECRAAARARDVRPGRRGDLDLLGGARDLRFGDARRLQHGARRPPAVRTAALLRLAADEDAGRRRGCLVSCLAISVLLVNLGSTGVFASVTSVSVVIVYLAYLFVTVPLLVKRVRAGSLFAEPIAGPGYFTLGRIGLPVNIVAVVFGLFMLVDIGWPRQEIYNPAGDSWVLQYSALLFVAARSLLGAIAYRTMRNQQVPAAASAQAAVDAAGQVAAGA